MGVEKQIIRPGTGPKPAPGQTVTVHCTGFGKGGDLSQQFWSTKDAGQKPFSFQIGKGAVIKGWDEGVIGMQIGEVARLRCSPDYAYDAVFKWQFFIFVASEILFKQTAMTLISVSSKLFGQAFYLK
ncbi:Peptidylprolyl isomerase [Raphanus sativus]|uniref:peptidylprolyl isomerase n=1 Tax=Raphanus sativus TaxID=3726 RepID=A0A6J0LI63_RAPSA|nr:peptidyl-prolyl cis-trans isomerase FKBP12-like [Raphanus sativus]KAJ4871729.1 Peptidylprolyl isomerase [Raphanus sativus]